MMTLKIITVYMNLVVCIYPLLTASMSWIKLTRYEGWDLQNKIGDWVNARDKTECSLRCVQKPSTQCCAISFDANTLECRHYTNNNVFLDEGSNKTTFITEYASVIFLKEKVTFEEAHTYCNTFGGRISIPADIDNWYNNGGRQCLCGWMSDEVQRKVVQANGTGNCANFSVGVQECPDQKNKRRVWCTVNA